MGEDLSLEGRMSVRTPMQWSDEENGGFSTAPASQLVRPVISEGKYGYERVNVSDQRRDPSSLLNWMERLIRTRKECPEFGWGEHEIVQTGNPQVFAHLCRWKGGMALAVHNLSGETHTVTLELSDDDAGHLIELFGDHEYEPFDKRSRRLRLEPYGYRWLRRSALHPTKGSEEGH